MSQTRMSMSLADVPMSWSARHEFQQYLAQLPASGSSSSNSIKSTLSDVDDLVQHSILLNRRVDDLHARLSEHEASGRGDDPELFWTTVSLLSNLGEVCAQLQRHRSDRRAADALARTQHNRGIVESLLRLMSVSSSAQSSGAFTAPTQSRHTVSPPLASAALEPAQGGYEYWRQRTLAGLEADDSQSTASTLEDGMESDAESVSSVLTDPDIHLASPATRLGGIRHDDKDQDDDLSEYDRALESKTKASRSVSGTDAPAVGGSETILQSDRATHEALSSELLRMASVLKSNSLAFADALERDRLLLEKAGTDLGQNLDLMTRTRGRLGVYSKKARSMGWFTLSAILIVLISWLFMFLLIRLT